MIRKILLSIALVTFISVSGAYAQCYSIVKEPLKNYFVLVIDRSGSMRGNAMTQAKSAVINFIQKMNNNDRAAVLAFSDNIEVVHEFSGDKDSLSFAVSQLSAYGGTALYDSVAKAFSMLTTVQGRKVIVFLTDGRNNRGYYNLRDLASMTVSRNQFVYGIGLGDVDQNMLQDLCGVTGASFEYTNNANQLKSLYMKTLNNHLKKFGPQQSKQAALTVTTIPPFKLLTVNGKKLANTPAKFDKTPVGTYTFGIHYDEGVYECKAPMKKGYRTIIHSTEDDLGTDMIFTVRPTGATVFIDGQYVGRTSLTRTIKGDDWVNKALNDHTQLRVKRVPRKMHKITIKAIPGFDFGNDQVLTFNIKPSGKRQILMIDVFRRKIVDQNGNSFESAKIDPFDQLENE